MHLVLCFRAYWGQVLRSRFSSSSDRSTWFDGVFRPPRSSSASGGQSASQRCFKIAKSAIRTCLILCSLAYTTGATLPMKTLSLRRRGSLTSSRAGAPPRECLTSYPARARACTYMYYTSHAPNTMYMYKPTEHSVVYPIHFKLISIFVVLALYQNQVELVNKNQTKQNKMRQMETGANGCVGFYVFCRSSSHPSLSGRTSHCFPYMSLYVSLNLLLYNLSAYNISLFV